MNFEIGVDTVTCKNPNQTPILREFYANSLCHQSTFEKLDPLDDIFDSSVHVMLVLRVCHPLQFK